MSTELQNIHLTELDFQAWEKGTLSEAKKESFLLHTGTCPHCGDAWFAYMNRHMDELPNPPAYLADEILERVKQPDVVIAQKAYCTSKKMQLLIYSLKISVAVAISILMLFAMDAEMFELMTSFIGFK